VDPFTVSTTISVPREQVFEYLADIANHAEFTDHYMVDWHLTREDPYGQGAGARFRIKAPLRRFAWADVTLAEVHDQLRGPCHIVATPAVPPVPLSTDSLEPRLAGRGLG